MPNLRFLLLFRGIFALLIIKFIVCDRKSLSPEVFAPSVDGFFLLSLKLWGIIKIMAKIKMMGIRLIYGISLKLWVIVKFQPFLFMY